MSRTSGVGLVALLALAACFVGCGGKTETTTPPPPKVEEREVTPIGEGGKAVAAKTPQEAWLNFIQATRSGDRQLLLSSILIPEDAKEYVASEFLVRAGKEILRREMAKQYGEEALKGHFEDVDTTEFDRDKVAAETKIEVQGDKAVAQKPDGRKFSIVKTAKGNWVVELPLPPLPSADEQKEAIRKNRAHLYAIHAARRKVGIAGYEDAESIVKLMSTTYEGYLKGSK